MNGYISSQSISAVVFLPSIVLIAYNSQRVEKTKPGLSNGQRQERRSKIEALPREMEGKIADLEHEYQVQVTLTACAAMRILVPGMQVEVLLRCRKFRRDLLAIWNPLTRRLDPLVCDECQKTTRVLTPRDRGPRVLLPCPSCAAKR